MLREKRLGVKYNEKYYSNPDWDKYKSFLTEMATYKLGISMKVRTWEYHRYQFTKIYLALMSLVIYSSGNKQTIVNGYVLSIVVQSNRPGHVHPLSTMYLFIS